jgi:flagellar hook-length control protein FliK
MNPPNLTNLLFTPASAPAPVRSDAGADAPAEGFGEVMAQATAAPRAESPGRAAGHARRDAGRPETACARTAADTRNDAAGAARDSQGLPAEEAAGDAPLDAAPADGEVADDEAATAGAVPATVAGMAEALLAADAVAARLNTALGDVAAAMPTPSGEAAAGAPVAAAASDAPGARMAAAAPELAHPLATASSAADAATGLAPNAATPPQAGREAASSIVMAGGTPRAQAAAGPAAEPGSAQSSSTDRPEALPPELPLAQQAAAAERAIDPRRSPLAGLRSAGVAPRIIDAEPATKPVGAPGEAEPAATPAPTEKAFDALLPLKALTAPRAEPAAQAVPFAEQLLAGAGGSRSVTVATPVGQPGFAQDLGQRVVLLATGQVKSAELALNPAELGPVRVSIEVRGQDASLVFVASAAATRSALEEALPRLREMFSQQGLNLADASVGAQLGQQGQGTSGRPQAARQRPGERATTIEVAPVAQAAAAARPLRLIDVIA